LALVAGLTAANDSVLPALGQSSSSTPKPALTQGPGQSGQAPVGRAGVPGDGRQGFGQPPRNGPGGSDFNPWWKDADVIKEIGLSPDQAAKIDRISAQRSKQIDPFLQEYIQQNAELDRIMRERTVDPSMIELQASKVLALKSKVDESRIVMLYKMNLVLTAEQAKKLQAIWERNHDRGRGRSGRNPSLR
jgi:Spy/CpxP family protein refolding chaperone